MPSRFESVAVNKYLAKQKLYQDSGPSILTSWRAWGGASADVIMKGNYDATLNGCHHIPPSISQQTRQLRCSSRSETQMFSRTNMFIDVSVSVAVENSYCLQWLCFINLAVFIRECKNKTVNWNGGNWHCALGCVRIGSRAWKILVFLVCFFLIDILS